MIEFLGTQPIKDEFLNDLLNEIAYDLHNLDFKIFSKKIDKGLQVNFHGNEVTIGYDCPVTFMRGLALSLEAIELKDFQDIRQIPKYDSLGVMIDCSRNAVLKVSTVKKLMRYLGLMGYKTVQLYTEDTYELEGYPYFGYMRGSYTVDEIKEIVDYSHELGLEVIPCIQTLAHLGASMRWQAFDEITDCDDILFVGEEKTYGFIEAMIKHASTNFSSRRINIGMDEAHNLGLGKYLQKHGFKERMEIMVTHLTKVVEICEKYNMKPMMWSDMFFRLLSPTGDYYEQMDFEQNEALSLLPKDIEIIYWDYYNKEESHYDNIINVHKQLPNTTIFAGGAWRWRGIVPDNSFSLDVSEKALNICEKQNINEIFVTAWGDDGGECATFSILPNLVYYAERCYENAVDEGLLEKRFKTFAGTSLQDFLLLDMANHLPDNPIPGRCSINPSKYLFYQDPLLGVFDKHVVLNETNEFYEKLAKEIEEVLSRNEKWEYIFTPIYLNAKILSLKAEMGIRLKKAYDQKNMNEIKECIGQLDILLNDIKNYHIAVRKQWIMENKMSGLEIQDQRIGGMLIRIEMVIKYLTSYVNGEIEKIEELEYEKLCFDCRTDESLPISTASAWWFEIISPNRMGRT